MHIVNRLFQILRDAVAQIDVRGKEAKGYEIIHSAQAGSSFQVLLKSNPPRGDVACVDCYFVKVYINKAEAERHRREFEVLTSIYLKKFSSTEVSFADIGADIGSEKAAILIIALGHALGLWEVIAPEADWYAGSSKLPAKGYVRIRREPQPLPATG